MRDEVFSFYSKSKPERVPLSQQKEFKPVRNIVIREAVQMMEQRQETNVDYNEPRQPTPEGTSPVPEHRTPPPKSVAACMIRMLKQKKVDDNGRSEYVFSSETGGPISPDSVLNMLHRVLDRAGLPRLCFHDLRHPYVKPTTKKFITFFEAFRAAI